MAHGRETALSKKIAKAVKRHYPSTWVFNVVGSPYQMTGVPDLLLCVEGLLIGAEVKAQRPGESREHAIERATPGQRSQIRRIREAGGTAGVVLSPDDALALIRQALENR